MFFNSQKFWGGSSPPPPPPAPPLATGLFMVTEAKKSTLQPSSLQLQRNEQPLQSLGKLQSGSYPLI